MKLNQNHFYILLFIIIGLTSCRDEQVLSPCDAPYLPLDETKVITKIGFGSCGSHFDDQLLLNTAAAQNPDLYIFAGDNIYADTEDMDVMREKYDLLCSKESFINLKNTAPFLAVWDDHDFGYNDAGGSYPKKVESKQVFMEFWDELNNTSRMAHEGIYDAKIIGSGNQRLQIILLDTRTFRSDLEGQVNSYTEIMDPSATILGTAQWQWLEQQLMQPADLRMIVSSTQFAVEHNGYEAWANFPLEQQKMYDLIESTSANGVFFISGDIHYSEFAKRTPSNTYPLYDITSSGITGFSDIVPNTYRVGNADNTNNVGVIDIEWNGLNTNIKFKIIDLNETILIQNEFNLSELQF